MTNWYVTTGVSTTKDSRCWELFANDRRRQDSLADRDHEPIGTLREDNKLWSFLAAIDQRRSELLTPASQDPGDLRKWAEEIARENFRDECWTDPTRRHALPAELATLAVLHRRERIGPDDQLYLIAGESNPVDSAALQAILAYLKGKEFLKVGAISRVGPFWLDPVETTQFDEQIQELWHSLAIDGDTRFVLTGGFKGVLIAIAGRLAQGHASVPIYYLHETGDDVVEILFEQNGKMRSCKIRDMSTRIG